MDRPYPLACEQTGRCVTAALAVLRSTHETRVLRRLQTGCGRWRQSGRRDRRGDTCGRDHGDLSANEIGRQRRQSIDLILGETVFDRDVLAFDIPPVFEALAKCELTARKRIRR